MRREIPLLITGIVGIFMILSFFIPHPWVSDTAGQIKNWFLVISAFAVVLGVGNLIRVNLHRIRRKDTDWGFKIITLVGLFGYALLALVTDVEMQIRPTWLTRSLGLVSTDRKEILAGRTKLFDDRERVASILESSADAAEARRRLKDEAGIDPEVVAPDLVRLGAAGVRKLEPQTVYADLESAWKNPDATKRTVQEIEGRLGVTGILPLVRDRLEKGADRRELMEDFSLTYDQAEDMIALGPSGLAALDPAAVRSELAQLSEGPPADDASTDNPSEWVFTYIYTPLQATMFSLLAFFIASAAFRAFRMRTLEAGLLLAAGLLVIFGRVPLGQFDWHIADQDFGFHTIMQWIMNVPTTAAMRGIKMGAAMGVVVMGLKVILGIERSYLGGD